MTNLKSTFYVDIEIQDIMKKNYQIKKILSFNIFLSIFSKMVIDTMSNFSMYTIILTGYRMIYHTLL